MYALAPLSPEEAKTIEEKIAGYNFSVAPPVPGADFEKPVYKVVGRDGELLGGLITSLDRWGALELENLWIDDKCRGMGLGSALIRAAENDAREKGRYLSIVSTWSYQARPLYEKHGYTLCSTVTDWPKGYDSYFLSKRLDRPSREYVPPKPDAGLEITLGDEKDAQFIHRKLHEYNCSKVPRLHAHIAVERKLVGGDGAMIAGCSADIDGLDIALLGSIWVDEAHRGAGAGSYLLGEVERGVKEAGGIFTVAYAYDWQVGFFEKNGYALCGAIEDYPRGHRRYALKKIL